MTDKQIAEHIRKAHFRFAIFEAAENRQTERIFATAMKDTEVTINRVSAMKKNVLDLLLLTVFANPLVKMSFKLAIEKAASLPRLLAIAAIDRETTYKRERDFAEARKHEQIKLAGLNESIETRGSFRSTERMRALRIFDTDFTKKVTSRIKQNYMNEIYGDLYKDERSLQIYEMTKLPVGIINEIMQRTVYLEQVSQKWSLKELVKQWTLSSHSSSHVAEFVEVYGNDLLANDFINMDIISELSSNPFTVNNFPSGVFNSIIMLGVFFNCYSDSKYEYMLTMAEYIKLLDIMTAQLELRIINIPQYVDLAIIATKKMNNRC